MFPISVALSEIPTLELLKRIHSKSRYSSAQPVRSTQGCRVPSRILPLRQAGTRRRRRVIQNLWSRIPHLALTTRVLQHDRRSIRQNGSRPRREFAATARYRSTPVRLSPESL